MVHCCSHFYAIYNKKSMVTRVLVKARVGIAEKTMEVIGRLGHRSQVFGQGRLCHGW